MSSLLVTGAAGYLGRRIIQLSVISHQLSVTGVYFRTPPPPDLPPNCQVVWLDLRDEDQVAQALDSVQPDAIIHTAPSNQSEEQIAAIAPVARIVAKQAARLGARLVHVSSDMVFDGLYAPYADGAPPSPIHPYGEAKAAAEAVVNELMPGAVIVRPSLIFGVDPLDHQTRWLVEGIRKKQTVRLFTDEFRCPIWVDNLARALLELAGNDYAGPLNVSGAQPLSRWDFGMKLLELLGLEAGEYVRPSTIAASGLRRPADLTLDVRRAQALLETPLLSVDEALARIRQKQTSEVCQTSEVSDPDSAE